MYSLTRDQLIFAGMSGVPIGINHAAVWKIMDELGDIDDRMGTFEKVLTLTHHDVERMRMRAEGTKGTPGRPQAKVVKPKQQQ